MLACFSTSTQYLDSKTTKLYQCIECFVFFFYPKISIGKHISKNILLSSIENLTKKIII